jgi:eukaryotic-like serine/threonine-protein kinase
MSHLQNHWEGVSLPGDFVLEQWLGGDESAAYFQTMLPGSGRRAVVKLIPESTVDAAAQLDLWRRTRQLRHPNLLELLDSGRAELAGEVVLYAVFESPDDTLAFALRHSPLTEPEAREILNSILDALRYLHTQALVIGTLDADHIVAVGDRIKLSTDALREGSDPSEDIRALGMFWKDALMTSSPRSQEIVPHAADPDPQTRWSLDQISAALLAPPAQAAPAPILPPPHPRTAEPAIPYHFPKWIAVGAAGVLLLILGLNLRRPAEVASEPAATTPVSIPAPKPVLPPAPKPSSAATPHKEVWRVIAFTYRTSDAAAKKVRQLNQHHPDLHATIFSPKRGGAYLVALGGPMTHDDALRLQHTAKGKGLPRDLYIQNFNDPGSRPAEPRP